MLRKIMFANWGQLKLMSSRIINRNAAQCIIGCGEEISPGKKKKPSTRGFYSNALY